MNASKTRFGFLLLLSLSGACRGDDDAAPAAKPRAPDAVVFKKREPPPKPELNTDPNGNLLPSGEKILWFEIPKGFTRNSNGRVHLMTGKGFQLDKLEEYVAARVLARKFKRAGKGGSYTEARSPEDPKRAPLNVTISRGFQPGEVFLRVDEYMPMVGKPLPLDQVKSALLQDQKQAE